MTTPNPDRHPAWKLQTELHAQELTAAELRGIILSLRGQLNRFHDEVARLKDLDTPKCLYCWADVPTREAARAHMEVCDRHPMAAMRKELDALRAELLRQNGLDGAADPTGQTGGDFDQPTMNCPKCQKEYQDFDGLGVVYCQPPAGCGFCRHAARTGEKCDYCGDVRAEGEPLRDGLPPGALRAAHAEWNVESEMNNQSLVATCAFSLHGTECSISTWKQPHSPMPVAAFRRWDEVRFKPIGKSWPEVETLAARNLGAEDSKAGRERDTQAIWAALGGRCPGADSGIVQAYHAGYDDAVAWRKSLAVTAEQGRIARQNGVAFEDRIRDEAREVRPTLAGRPIPWSMLEGK